MKPDLSLLISGIRTANWPRMFEQAKSSCSRHSFEIVFCSPNDLPRDLLGESNVKCIRDFGSPSRCLQRASCSADGRFLAIASDDGILLRDGLSDSIDEIESSGDPERDIVAMRYTEGQNFHANRDDFSSEYWRARYHSDLRLPGVDESWKICLMFLMSAERFRYLGGIDCRFEHYNFNLHDLAFRAQRDGSKIIISSDFVSMHDWDPSRTVHNSPILQACFLNDRPLFESIYSTRESAERRPIRLSIDNWQNEPTVWSRSR